jgi:hypothetical protein
MPSMAMGRGCQTETHGLFFIHKQANKILDLLSNYFLLKPEIYHKI